MSLVLFWLLAIGSAPQEPRPLGPGELIEGEIAGGETQIYRIPLTAGQFLRLVVEQKSINVALSVAPPLSASLIC